MTASALRATPGPVPAEALAAFGRAAIGALYDELALDPKPGLVSFVDAGSHDDMDARTFLRSLFALRHYFPRIAAAGAADSPFPVLQALGQAAEARMLAATAGVNTHRGVVFTLGLLCASAGHLAAHARPLAPDALRHALVDRWGEALRGRAGEARATHGQQLARRHGLRAVSEEAALGYPVLFDVALPALRGARRAGLDRRRAQLQTVFAVMAVLDDTNLVHRGGLAGLRDAQRAARGFLAAGGAGRPDAIDHARRLHAAFVRRRLSPGGTADMLAAACWLDRVCPPP